MLGSAVDSKVRHLLPAKRPARNHTLNGLHENTLGKLAAEDFEWAPFFDAAWVSRVPVIDLILRLVSGEHDLLRVDDYNIVAVVHVRRVSWLMLAAKPRRNDGRNASYDQPVGIDQNPLLLNVGWFC